MRHPPRRPRTPILRRKQMGRPLKIQKTNTKDAAKQGGTYNVGVAGGNTALAGAQIQIRCKIGSNAEADGYIVRQKGAKKFLVTDGSNTGVCVVVDKNDAALGEDEMTITMILPDSGTDRIEYLTNKFALTHPSTPGDRSTATRYAVSFTDIADGLEKKAGDDANGTIDVAQIDNDDTYEE
jgi:hypothetical protein